MVLVFRCAPYMTTYFPNYTLIRDHGANLFREEETHYVILRQCAWAIYVNLKLYYRLL